MDSQRPGSAPLNASSGEALPVPPADSLKTWLTPPGSQERPRLNAEKEPDWPLEGDDDASEINPRVWQSFRAELADRLRHLAGLVRQVQQQGESEALRQEVFRALHIVQSAARVVPLAEVVCLTGLLAGQLEASRLRGESWPLDGLDAGITWLGKLAALPAPTPGVLAEGRQLCNRLG